DGPIHGLELIKTPDRGIGLRTKEDIKNGGFVMEYVGEVLLNSNKKHSKNYAFSLVSIDGRRKFSLNAERHGNYARFIN
ncbi:histone-lysine N-methyltransferase SETMAR-like, partial [Aphelenchoides avenae]